MNGKRTLLGIAVVALAICCAVEADTHYVSPDGLHLQPYVSWENAATNIQSAVDSSSDGDTVLVMDGTYRSYTQVLVDKGITVKSVNGPSVTTIAHTNVINHRCVGIAHADAVIDGFTIRDGYINQGGGVYIQNGGTLQNCTIFNNVATDDGGGVYCYLAGVVKNCVIKNNTAYDLGGGIRCWYTGGIIENCVIKNNSSRTCGGVGGAGEGSMTSCSVVSNVSGYAGGVGWNAGPTASDCLIAWNYATNYSGGIFCTDTGRWERCVISANVAGTDGGGIRHYGSVVDFIDCLITGNSAGGHGGGLHALVVKLRGCIIGDNEATGVGGGFYGNYVDAQSCTIAGNTASSGGGIYWADGTWEVQNCIIASNSAPTAAEANIFLHSIIKTNYLRYCCVPVPHYPLSAEQGNTMADPGFVNWQVGDYRIKYSSPCIDAGTNQDWMTDEVDITGRSRIVGSIVDIGAYESGSLSDDLTSVSGSHGGGVTEDFSIGKHEITVLDFVDFLNACDADGELVVSNGQVKNVTSDDLYCLTTDADARGYVMYDTYLPVGQRFHSASLFGNHPIIMISWCGAAAFCNWLSSIDSLDPVYDVAGGWGASLSNTGYRLPSEAQWLKAAAWDNTTAEFFLYGTGSNVLSVSDANYVQSGDSYENNPVGTCPVGSYAPESPYGLKDASGNVWEWCQDFYDSSGSDPDADAHAVRGGSWGSLVPELKTSTRCGNKPGDVLNSVGFRVVKP